MQGVIAVVTTGIYCRSDGCGAQPRAENTRHFPYAAAAEAAGYRACLRCRPYRLPLVTDWTGPELVCRAVRLVLDGALDQDGEVRLAEKVGVSPRHLRRLFTTHLGVTPDGLARSARAHFARRLLDDTDLMVTEIAHAAGFGSLRQFNRVLRQVFNASPGELRARRRQSDRLVADGGLALRLAYVGPLDWPVLARCLAAVGVAGVEHVADGVYRRTVEVGGDPGVLELGPGGDDHLVLRAHLPHWDGLVHVVARARRIAGLDVDLTEPVRQLAADPVVGSLVNARPGVRPPGTWDAFETGVRAIVEHHTARATAADVMRRVVERHGTAVAGLRPFGLTHTFPSPRVLAGADLSDIGLSASKAAALRAFSRAVAVGEIRLDRSVSLDRLVASVEAVDGVEPWTAHYLALRLGEPDACPISDRDLEPGQPLHAGATHVAHVVERWRPWRALAVTHLWLARRTPAPAIEGHGAA